MNKLIAAVTVLAVSTAQANDIIVGVPAYYVDEFIQFNGTNTFVDSFSDGDEPPSGPNSASDYIVSGSFGADRENAETGLLELNLSDAAGLPEDGLELNAAVGDSSYFFSSGSGGSLTGVFKINDGFFVNSDFGIGIDNYQTADLPPGARTDESAICAIFVSPDGSIFAFWGIVKDHSVDITDEFGANTSITLELLVNVDNEVTATWDYGSDGSIDLVRRDFGKLEFLAGTYTGTFAIVAEPGACCLPAGSCVVVPGFTCTNLGGSFLGYYTECSTPASCPGNLDGDCVVGITDFLGLLAAWGPNPGHPADLDGDDVVGINDFLLLLANWGPCP